MNTYLNLVKEWQHQQLNLRAQFFKNDGFQTETLRKTWVKYLVHRGYDLGIINFIANPYLTNLGNDLLLSFRETKNWNHVIGRTAIAILKHEYKLLLRRFTDWVTELLKNKELEIFANSNLDIDTIYDCMKFKNNGKIKAWYDDQDGEGYWNPGYDHETWPDKYDPDRHEVFLSFRHYADLILVDDSSDWVWYSEPWQSSGYISACPECEIKCMREYSKKRKNKH